MKFYVLTLFPDLIRTAVNTSITGRAIRNGVLSVETVNIRDYSVHGTMRVDDYPYGGGAGMVMEAEPVYQAVRSVEDRLGRRPRVVYLTPQAKVLTQTKVEELAGEEELVLLCGHYEGIDERVLEEVVTDYVSIGDYVLTGGELAAAVLIDAVSRFVPGVLHNEESSQFESFQDNLLEYPQYTRPDVWHGRAVPEVLLSGDHGRIEEWRHGESLRRTAERRPDLLEGSYQVQCIWYGDEENGELAERVADALSRYGKTLDYNRKRIRKQNHSASERELLVFVLPEDPQAEMSFRERFRNLRGKQTPAVLLQQGGDAETEDLMQFFRERGFLPVSRTETAAAATEKGCRDFALSIRMALEGTGKGPGSMQEDDEGPGNIAEY